ncbi:DUF397 domain-containing protein [Streptomyces sp. NPDC058989]|uniref:DUF397 domain-containing protein n=1 Tax=Streptomyces sp. NPDC058989 TaxID=3346686 RepID=UPI0036865E20
MSAPNWHKSSYSGGGSNDCVEVADNDPAAVLVRDTKNEGRGPVLTVTPEAWSSFVDYARR